MQRKGTEEVATDQSVSLRKTFTTISRTCAEYLKWNCVRQSVIKEV